MQREQLGVHHEALRNWLRQAEADKGERHDRPTTDMVAENRRLARENAELRRVNEVRHAASAYFAGEIGPTGGGHELRRPHGFPAGLGPRVLGIAPSTSLLRLGVPARRRRCSASATMRASRADREDPIGQRVRHHLRLHPLVWLELRRQRVHVAPDLLERDYTASAHTALSLAEPISPGVTVIAQDPAAIGRTAVERLFARFDGDTDPAKTFLLPTRLVRRGSGEIPPPS